MAIQKSNRLLSDLVERMDKTERRLKLVEKKLDESSSNVDSTPSSSRRRSTKRDVPDEVRVCLMYLYRNIAVFSFVFVFNNPHTVTGSSYTMLHIGFIDPELRNNPQEGEGNWRGRTRPKGDMRGS